MMPYKNYLSFQKNLLGLYHRVVLSKNSVLGTSHQSGIESIDPQIKNIDTKVCFIYQWFCLTKNVMHKICIELDE